MHTNEKRYGKRRRLRRTCFQRQRKATLWASVLMLQFLVAIFLGLNAYHYFQISHERTHHLSRTSTRSIFRSKINLTLGTLHDLTDDDLIETNNDNNSITIEQAKLGREPLLEILKDAGVTDIDLATLQQLPKWSTVQQLYGDGPVIFGLSQCQVFRDSTVPSKRTMGPAGLFNSGTNVLSLYLQANCDFPGIQWQVPWGKHVMASLRGQHFVPNLETFDITTILPIVTIRDPYYWMQSMCRHEYSLKWHHRPEHCPNLVPNEHDYSLYAFPGRNIPVRISWDKQSTTKWNSLAHLWSDWNGQYYRAQHFPKLIVRFEDLIFYPKQLITQICTCGGGTPSSQFLYVLDSAKFGPGHGTAKTSLASAMIRYGRSHRRTKGLTVEDLQLAKDALDPDLMEWFHYTKQEDY